MGKASTPSDSGPNRYQLRPSRSSKPSATLQIERNVHVELETSRATRPPDGRRLSSRGGPKHKQRRPIDTESFQYDQRVACDGHRFQRGAGHAADRDQRGRSSPFWQRPGPPVEFPVRRSQLSESHRGSQKKSEENQ